MVCDVFEIVSHSLLPLKIVHISKDDKDRWHIFVWDGTEMPPCNISVKYVCMLHPIQLSSS